MYGYVFLACFVITLPRLRLPKAFQCFFIHAVGNDWHPRTFLHFLLSSCWPTRSLCLVPLFGRRISFQVITIYNFDLSRRISVSSILQYPVKTSVLQCILEQKNMIGGIVLCRTEITLDFQQKSLFAHFSLGLQVFRFVPFQIVESTHSPDEQIN